MVVLGQACSESRQENPPRRYPRCDANWLDRRPVHKAMPQEKPLGRTLVPVPQTDTGGQVETLR